MDRNKNNVWLGIAGFIILAIGFQPETLAAPSPNGVDLSPKARLVETYGKLPLSFEANQGQIGDQVKFLSRGPGYTLFLTPTEAVLSLRKRAAHQAQRSEKSVIPGKAAGRDPESIRAIQTNADWMSASAGMTQSRIDADHKPAQTATLRMQLVGANPKPQISGVDALPGKTNYFRGNDPKKWRTNVLTYAKVEYENVYPGIDLVYYGNQRQLEHDFVVAPGADPKTIRLAFTGAEKIVIAGQGDLVLKAAGSDVRLREPRVYQDINGRQREIEGRFVLHPVKGQGKPHVGFHVAAYDKGRPLIIDPVLVYSTYLGGGAFDPAYGIAVNSAGNAYVTGYTGSTDFPTANPVQGSSAGGVDAFVAKFSADGLALIYSTYLGGGGFDNGGGIATDSAGNAYVVGVTYSTDFPTANPLQGSLAGGADGFVAKLNADGSALIYSTYLGGSVDDLGHGIAVDSAGNGYVTGVTSSANFPTVNPVQGALVDTQDAFVAKLNAGGSALVYSTYLGGGDSADTGRGIAVDSAGGAYVVGYTNAASFPTVNPVQDALAGPPGVLDIFVTKLSTSGSALVYSTYLGGSDYDVGFGIAVDSAGNAYVTGYTFSADFPTVNPVQGALGGSVDTFVTKLSTSGSALVYSTYLGGSVAYGQGIAVDSAGNAYVTGTSYSSGPIPGFPLVNPIPNSWSGGHIGFTAGDAFVSKLNPLGSSLVYSTLLGGNRGTGGVGIAVDAAGNAYVTGITSSESGFPLVNALQPVYGGQGGQVNTDDAFVAKISDTATPPPQPVLSVTPASLDFGTVTAGSSKDLEFTVTNTGAGTLTGTASASAPFSIVSGASFSLAAGASQAVVVRFSPTATGSFTANVSFTSNGGNASQVVTGTGIAPAINVTPTTLAFGSVAVGSSADLTFTVDNTGGGTLSGTCSANVPFSLPNGCSFNLTSGQTAVVTVRFSPTATGAFTGNVGFTSNGGDVSSAVTGTGTVKPPLTISSISPTSGIPGTVVTIKGKKFGATQGLGFVSFGSVKASINSWSDTQIVAVTPAGPAGTVPLSVNTTAGKSNSKDFIYLTFTIAMAPPVDSLNWANGYGAFNEIGNHMHHTGVDFGGAESTTVVKAAEVGTVAMVVGLVKQGGGANPNCKTDPSKGDEQIQTWNDTNKNGVVDLGEISGLVCTGRNKQNNHGLGMTIIMQHNGTTSTLYGHLYAVKQEIWDALQAGATYSPIKGEAIGVLGHSEFNTLSSPNFSPHIHFEVKSQPVLESPRSDSKMQYWGYTPDLPDGYGYRDPFLYFYPPASESPVMLAVKVISEEGGSLEPLRGIRVYGGPGVNYSVLGWTGLNETFVANATAISTAPGDAAPNRFWYRIYLPNRLSQTFGWVASRKLDGTQLVQEDSSATIVEVIKGGGVSEQLRRDPTIDCAVTPLNCVQVWDNTKGHTGYLKARTWNGLRLVTFASQPISGVMWDGVYIPKFYYDDPRTTPKAAPPQDNSVGDIGTTWIRGDSVK